MLRNYGVVAWRHLVRRPLHAGINVVGLGLGVSCCLLGLRYAQYQVAAVIDIPENSSLQLDFLLPMADAEVSTSWDSFLGYTFVRLRPDVTAQDFQARARALLAAQLRAAGVAPEGVMPQSVGLLTLQQLHVASDMRFVFGVPVQRVYLRIIGALGMAMLLVACANFTTLSLAEGEKKGPCGAAGQGGWGLGGRGPCVQGVCTASWAAGVGLGTAAPRSRLGVGRMAAAVRPCGGAAVARCRERGDSGGAARQQGAQAAKSNCGCGARRGPAVAYCRRRLSALPSYTLCRTGRVYTTSPAPAAGVRRGLHALGGPGSS